VKRFQFVRRFQWWGWTELDRPLVNSTRHCRKRSEHAYKGPEHSLTLVVSRICKGFFFRLETTSRHVCELWGVESVFEKEVVKRLNVLVVFVNMFTRPA
jgi:hypothetical protein